MLSLCRYIFSVDTKAENPLSEQGTEAKDANSDFAKAPSCRAYDVDYLYTMFYRFVGQSDI